MTMVWARLTKALFFFEDRLETWTVVYDLKSSEKVGTLPFHPQSEFFLYGLAFKTLQKTFEFNAKLFQSSFDPCSSNMSSKETPKGARKSSEQVVTEPRFAKAHTDKRFSKISKKDRTVHLDSRFKHIVKDRKYAIAGTLWRTFYRSWWLKNPRIGWF